MILFTKSQLIQNLETQRFWTIIVAILVTVLQWIGHPMPVTVYNHITELLALLFSGSTLVSVAHALTAHAPVPTPASAITTNTTAK